MSRKCPLCGKETQDQVSRCPRCGEPLEGTRREEAPERSVFSFPQRRTPSYKDDLAASRRQLFEGGGKGEVMVMNTSWEEIFQERPFDIPIFLKQGDMACVGVYFSQAFMSRAQTLGDILEQRRSYAFQAAAFLGERYPLLRCQLLVPDDPSDPLVLEAPLDLLSGDVQEFCQAALDGDRLSIIVAHEDGGEATARGAQYHSPGLSSILYPEVRRVLAHLAPQASRVDFDAAVKEMEATYPSAHHGLDRSRMAKLKFVRLWD